MKTVTTVSLSLLFLAVFLTACTTYKPVAPGVGYTHITDKTVPWSIHVVKFNYHNHDLHLTDTLAHNTIFGLATVPAQVAAMPKSAGEPIAAVNGDFFLIKKEPYQGDPLGLQIFNSELITSPSKNLEFWIDRSGQPHVDQLKPNLQATLPNSKTITLVINKPRQPNEAALLTPILGSSTRTSNGVELVLQRDLNSDWLPVHTGEKVSAHITEINTHGNTTLRPDQLVLSIGPKLAKRLPKFSVGDHVALNFSLSPDLKNVATAIGGGPILVRDGKNLHHQPRGKTDHMTQRNPRTAIGWNNREFFMVVADGRKPDLSVGMTFSELASLMIKLGCKEAINLDGGGSTTMWLNGKVVNHPSEKGVLRQVANTLVLVQKP